MKLLVSLALSLAFCASFVDAQTTRPDAKKIACVGDSITMGAGIKDRSHDSYPAQLQQMLGADWQVKNFGSSGTTLLKKGDRPYWTQKQFTQAKEFAPDIVILKLGTNDSKPQNWKFKDDAKPDLAAMVDEFQNLPSRPTIFLCRPVPAYPGFGGIRDDVIKNEVIPVIDEVAKEKNVKAIDLYAALSDKKELFPDTVHPNAEGARLIAAAVYTALTGKPAPASAPSTEPAAAR